MDTLLIWSQLGADIPMAANCTNKAKSPFLSKSASKVSHVSKIKVLEIWKLHVRSVARDLCQSSHTLSHTRLIKAVSLSASWLIVKYIVFIPDPLENLMLPKIGQETYS